MKRTPVQIEAISRLKARLPLVRAVQQATRATIDFETRCDLDVTEVGAFAYSRHPSCEILMMSFNLTGKPGDTKLWTYLDKNPPTELLDAIKSGAIMNAFNTYFEYCIWLHVAVPKLGWPEFTGGFERTLDVADKCKAMAMPSNLDEAATHSKIKWRKNPEGKRLIGVFSMRQKKGEYAGKFVDPTDPEYAADWKMFKSYCVSDTDAEVALDNMYPDLDPIEQLIAWMTQDINFRGIQVDRVACKAAEHLKDEIREKYNGELSRMTKGVITKGTQRARVKKWLLEHGQPMKNMQGDTIKGVMREKLTKPVRRMLELYTITGSTAASKFSTMLAMTDPVTLRIHELLNYHKARTGRYGGKGIQIQNLPRPVLPKGTDYRLMIKLIKRRDLKAIEDWCKMTNSKQKNPDYHINPMQVLTSCIRACIVPDLGKRFLSADYSAIECRKLMWIADQQDALDIFKRKEDIYLHMAATIYSKPYETMNKDSRERPLGKETVLGAGYEMGAYKFRDRVDTQAGIKISQKEATRVIKLFRKRFNKVPKFWRGIEKAALKCVHTRKPVDFKMFKLYMTKFGDLPFFVIKLPSGHKLYYPEPKIEMQEVYGEMKPQLTYMGYDSYTHQWVRLTTYGGKETENVTQASSRDLMVLGMLLLHLMEYSLIMSVHDEAVSEDDEDFGSLKEFEELLCTLPKWAEGMPVESEGWEGYNYRK